MTIEWKQVPWPDWKKQGRMWKAEIQMGWPVIEAEIIVPDDTTLPTWYVIQCWSQGVSFRMFQEQVTHYGFYAAKRAAEQKLRQLFIKILQEVEDTV